MKEEKEYRCLCCGWISDLQDKERQARELCEQYEKRLPNKNDQEL